MFPPPLLHSHLLVLESAAQGAALGRNIPTASVHTDALGAATVVAVVRATLHLTLDVRFHRGSAAGSILGAAWAALLKRSAAGLAGFLSGRAVHLDPGKAAVVVLIVLAICHLAFQTVHIRHLVFR